MAESILLRLDHDLRERVVQCARYEGKTVSQLIRQIIFNYVQERDISGHIDSLWVRIGKQLDGGSTPSQKIDRVIKQVRARRK